MRKNLLLKAMLWVSIPTALLTSCVKDDYLVAPKPVPNQSFIEEFDTLSSALSRGWKIRNTSDSIGGGTWYQGGGIPAWFPAFSGNTSNVGFVGADFTSTAAQAQTISNWLISPWVTMQNGDKITFYTRGWQQVAGADSTDYANRLQVRLNTSTGFDGLNAGAGFDPGDFTSSLLDINPFYVQSSFLNPKPTAYPTRWTRFETTVYGLDKPTKGRFAFRYFVELAGYNGLGTGVGIDYVTYKSLGY